MDYRSILKELVSVSAVSGFEKQSVDKIKCLMEDICDEVTIDKFFNVIAFKKGVGINKKKLLICAHYDEIGFLVKSIDKNGFLKLTNMGGFDPKILLAQEVIIHGKSDIVGIIGAKPPHLLKPEETKKSVKLQDLAVDTGLSETEIRDIVTIGDVVTLKVPFMELLGDKISTKSMDNRCGVAALIGILDSLKDKSIEHDLYVVATVQEEVGLRGAEVMAYNIFPDAAIVIDACHGDMPDCQKDDVFPLGKGPAIGIGPNLHKRLTGRIIEAAVNLEIPHQTDVEPEDTGTEAWAIQVSRSGIATALVSIPTRYMHTGIETISISDIESTVKLVTKFISDLDAGLEGIL